MQNIPPSEATSFSATYSIPCLLHNKSVHYYFHHSPTHTLPPNSFSPPTFCSHIYSSLNKTDMTVHMFSALQTKCWHTKMRDKSERPTNQAIPYLMHQSQIGTNNTSRSSNLKPQQSWGKKTNKMQQYRSFIVNYGCWLLTMSQHVSGIFMPIFRSKDHVLLHMKCICW